jgi:hypothetical protein
MCLLLGLDYWLNLDRDVSVWTLGETRREDRVSMLNVDTKSTVLLFWCKAYRITFKAGPCQKHQRPCSLNLLCTTFAYLDSEPKPQLPLWWFKYRLVPLLDWVCCKGSDHIFSFYHPLYCFMKTPLAWMKLGPQDTPSSVLWKLIQLEETFHEKAFFNIFSCAIQEHLRNRDLQWICSHF